MKVAQRRTRCARDLADRIQALNPCFSRAASSLSDVTDVLARKCETVKKFFYSNLGRTIGCFRA